MGDEHELTWTGNLYIWLNRRPNLAVLLPPLAAPVAPRSMLQQVTKLEKEAYIDSFLKMYLRTHYKFTHTGESKVFSEII
jgi:hypothetical protein